MIPDSVITIYVIRKFKQLKDELEIIKVRSFKIFTRMNSFDLEQTCDIFNSIVKTVADKHAPFVTHKIKGKIEAWVTNDLLQAIKERNYFKKKANQTKFFIDWNNFTQKRNQVINMKNTLKQDYFNTLLTDDTKQPNGPNGKNITASVKSLGTNFLPKS